MPRSSLRDLRTASSSGTAALRVFLDEVSNDFGVCFGDELVAFALELFLQFEIVLDDAVVDDHDFAGAVAVRVRIFFGGAAVRGPAGVADSVGAFNGRFLNDFFQVAQLTRGAADFQLSCLSRRPRCPRNRSRDTRVFADLR